MPSSCIPCICCGAACPLSDRWHCRECDGDQKWWRSSVTRKCIKHGGVEERKLRYLDETADLVWRALFDRLCGNVISTTEAEYLIEKLTKSLSSECWGATESYGEY